MSDIELAIFAFATLGTSIFSSIAGGGGGFIGTPLLIFFGLSPAEAIASGKLLGVSVSVGNLSVMRKHKLHDWSKAVPIMIIATIMGIVASQLIVQIEGEVYQKVIGVLILAMIPVVHYKKIGHVSKKLSKQRERFGYVAVAGTLLLVGVFSSGLGVLVGLSISSFMGMSALEANVTKRIAQILLSSVIFVGLIGSGLIIWKVAVVGAIMNFIGGQIGAHISVKKGNVFVMDVLKVAMVIAGISMLIV